MDFYFQISEGKGLYGKIEIDKDSCTNVTRETSSLDGCTQTEKYVYLCIRGEGTFVHQLRVT